MHENSQRSPFLITVAIASREVRERFRLFLVAAALAVIPFVAALVPGARDQRGAAIATVAGVLAVAYACGVAVMQGVTTIGRDLAEKRLSFFFSKPVPAWTIWAGKAAAALLTMAVAAAIIVVPAYLSSPGRWAAVWSAGGSAILIATIAICISIFVLSHAIVTMVRSRSILLVLDAVCAGAAVLMAFLIVRPLFFFDRPRLVGATLQVIALAVLAIFAVAPALQLARGRCDARRNHLALSRALWPAIGAVMFLGAAWSVWLTSTTFSSIDVVHELEHAPGGRWVYMRGGDAARGHLPAGFLIDTTTKRGQRLDMTSWADVHFSRDGRSMVWIDSIELIPRTGSSRLYFRRLAEGAEAVATPILLNRFDRLSLSDDASRVAIVHGAQLRVHDIGSGTLLAAASLPEGRGVTSLYFVTPDVLRMMVVPSSTLPVSTYELDVAQKKLTRTGERPQPKEFGYASVSASADGTLVYLAGESTIVDARSGVTRATLPVKPKHSGDGRMLNDGTVVISLNSMLHVFDRNGQPLKRIPLPWERAFIAGQVGDGEVLALGVPKSMNDHRRAMLVIDLARGAVEQTVPGVAGPGFSWRLDPRLPVYSAGSTFAATTRPARHLTYWTLK